jgi:hypothetical protein
MHDLDVSLNNFMLKAMEVGIRFAGHVNVTVYEFYLEETSFRFSYSVRTYLNTCFASREIGSGGLQY